VDNQTVLELHRLLTLHCLDHYQKLEAFHLWVHTGSVFCTKYQFHHIGFYSYLGNFVLLLYVQPFQPTPAPVPTPLAGWMSNPPTVSHPTISGSAIGLGSPSISAALKHPRTPTNPSLDYPSAETDHISKRTRPMGITDEVILFHICLVKAFRV
jgi:hypothetical protein